MIITKENNFFPVKKLQNTYEEITKFLKQKI